MNRFVILVAVISLLCPTLSLAEEELDPYIRAYKNQMDRLSRGLEKIKGSADQLAKDYNAYKSMYEKVEKMLKLKKPDLEKIKAQQKLYSDFQEQNLAKFSDGLGALFISDLMTTNFKSGADVISRANKSAKHIEHLKTCFDDDGKKDALCNEWLNSFSCNIYGSDDYGLFQDSTVDFKKIEKEYIDVLSVADDTTRFGELICYLKGDVFGNYSQSALYLDPRAELPKYISPFDISKPEQFKSDCVDTAPMEERNRLIDSIKDNYPNTYYQFYKYDLPAIKKKCQMIADFQCKSTYAVKDQIIFSYVTQGCVVRDITTEDIETDMKYSMSTNAEKLIHSQLGDRIDFCQVAYDGGFRWDYKKPVVPATCAKDNNLVEKKKGRKKK